MQALISPDEKVRDSESNILGDRVAQIATDSFPVANPLFWAPCADDVVADEFYWVDNQILPVPLPPPSIAAAATSIP
jgi:hypothetical protein